MTKLFKHCYLIIFCLLLSSCVDDGCISIFNAPVFLRVNIDHNYNELRDPGNTLALTKGKNGEYLMGYGGLLLVRAYTYVPNREPNYDLYAYDLACPKEKLPEIKIKDIGKGRAQCQQCGAIYNIQNGSGNSETPDIYKGRLDTYRTDYEVDQNRVVFVIQSKKCN